MVVECPAATISVALPCPPLFVYDTVDVLDHILDAYQNG